MSFSEHAVSLLYYIKYCMLNSTMFYPLCNKKITPKTQERYFTPKRRDLKRVKNQFSLHDIPVHFLGSKCLSTYICNTVAHSRHLDAFELPVVSSRAC